jgi:hypothetical protein
MQAYGDKARLRAAERDDHHSALGVPADDIGGAVGSELCDPGRWPGSAVMPDIADVAGDTRLPSYGRHYPDGIHLESSRDHQGEFVLHLSDAGNGSMRVNLDVGDLAALRAALPGRQGATPAEVREFLEGLIKVWDPDPGKSLDGMAERSIEAVRRVISMLGEA